MFRCCIKYLGIVHGRQRPTLYYAYPYMASANCSVPMMETVTLQNAMICCNALLMHYAHTNTHNPHTRSHHSKPTQTTYAHCMHHTYLHTNALFVLCDFIETATVAPLYIPSAASGTPHWTTPHHLPRPPLMCTCTSQT